MPAMASLANGGAKNFGQTSRVGYAWGSPPNLTYRSGSNIVHIFNSSGVFLPTRSISNVEYLVIAGGGGTVGFPGGGGGGAGGYRSSVVGETSGGGAAAEARITTPAYTPQTVTIGAGGTGGYGGSLTGGDVFYSAPAGSSTTFGSITSTGGSGGALASWKGPWPYANKQVPTGGSGGGGSMNYYEWLPPRPVAFGGGGTAGQGYGGGNGAGWPSAPDFEYNGGGGGGGGAAAAGSNAVGTTYPTNYSGGAGGSGRASSITGTSVTRAGGGGGGHRFDSGPFGAPGAGAAPYNADPAENSGSGGSAAGVSSGVLRNGYRFGANGGSGVVILRYPA